MKSIEEILIGLYGDTFVEMYKYLSNIKKLDLNISYNNTNLMNKLLEQYLKKDISSKEILNKIDFNNINEPKEFLNKLFYLVGESAKEKNEKIVFVLMNYLDFIQINNIKINSIDFLNLNFLSSAKQFDKVTLNKINNSLNLDLNFEIKDKPLYLHFLDLNFYDLLNESKEKIIYNEKDFAYLNEICAKKLMFYGIGEHSKILDFINNIKLNKKEKNIIYSYALKNIFYYAENYNENPVKYLEIYNRAKKLIENLTIEKDIYKFFYDDFNFNTKLKDINEDILYKDINDNYYLPTWLYHLCNKSNYQINSQKEESLNQLLNKLKNINNVNNNEYFNLLLDLSINIEYLVNKSKSVNTKTKISELKIFLEEFLKNNPNTKNYSEEIKNFFYNNNNLNNFLELNQNNINKNLLIKIILKNYNLISDNEFVFSDNFVDLINKSILKVKNKLLDNGLRNNEINYNVEILINVFLFKNDLRFNFEIAKEFLNDDYKFFDKLNIIIEKQKLNNNIVDKTIDLKNRNKI